MLTFKLGSGEEGEKERKSFSGHWSLVRTESGSYNFIFLLNEIQTTSIRKNDSSSV